MVRAIARTYGSDLGWTELPPPPDLRHLYTRRERSPGERKRVVVHAGASRYLNQWPLERFSAVAKALSSDFDVTWIRHDITTGPAPEGIRTVAVTSLAEFADLLANADLFLGNNSGPMHFANALGCPGVAVTGPSAIGWNPYWYRERWTVLRHPNLHCAPCEKIDHVIWGCSNAETPMACLNYWTPDVVESACRSRLAMPREGAS
jgi:ADP-heptose:LPS heptosyltransferase